MFWIASKLFWIVAQPLAMIGLLVALGLVLLVATRRRRFGGLAVFLGFVLLVLTGFTNIGVLLLQPLEDRYPQVSDFPADVTGIIVLGGGTVNSVSTARRTYTLSDAGERYVEALRLAQAYPEVPLLVSGGTGALTGDAETDSQSVERLFSGFDLGGAEPRYETASRNTYENAVNSAALLAPTPGARYVLITSAYHMPRAVALFEKAGVSVLPWPVDYRTEGDEAFALRLVDASGNLDSATTAMREWIGLLVYWLSGRIDSPLP